MFFHYREKYGETFVIWLGRQPRIYTSNADLFKKVEGSIYIAFIEYCVQCV